MAAAANMRVQQQLCSDYTLPASCLIASASVPITISRTSVIEAADFTDSNVPSPFEAKHISPATMSLDLGSSSSIPSGDLSGLNDADKKELAQFVQNEQQKANLQESIHTLTAMCFKKCITSTIKDGKLDKYEEPCVQNCVGRFMDANFTVIKHLEQMRTS